jgi:hypothetical protein
MSELSVGQLRGLTVNDNVISMPSGHSLYAPGHVVQVVSATSSTEVITTSTTFVTSGLSATITPSSTSSKIAVFVSTGARTTNSFASSFYTIFRGTVAGTNLGHVNNGFAQLYGAGGDTFSPVSPSVVDSPNTTSAQTYTLGFRVNSGTGAATQVSSTLGSIILMEIAQ